MSLRDNVTLVPMCVDKAVNTIGLNVASSSIVMHCACVVFNGH